ncbi:MAG: hypothetical protein ACLRSW_00210 [Christensenellaceae bacterium]
MVALTAAGGALYPALAWWARHTENIVTLCRNCHRELDQTPAAEPLERVMATLIWYPDFSDDDRIYKK